MPDRAPLHGKHGLNREEVTGVYNDLKARGVRTELRVFPGSHSWAPADVLRDAVAWPRRG